MIARFKEALAEAIDGYMECAPERINALHLQQDLVSALGLKQRMPINSDNPERVDQIFGGDFTLSVKRIPIGSGVLAIEARFDITCGFDTVLLTYERDRSIWKCVIRWQSGDYDDPSGAFGDFFSYAALRPAEMTNWVLAIAHGRPWCSSNLSAFDVDFIASARRENQQAVLFHHEYAYRRWSGPKVSANANSIEFRFETESLDPSILVRPGIVKLKLTEAAVVRAQPIALNARDFVDEWLSSDWNDALQWSDPQHANILRTLHTAVIAQRTQREPVMSFQYGSARACGEDHKHFQIELDRDPGEPIYFQIAEIASGYEMVSASGSPDRNCRGAVTGVP